MHRAARRRVMRAALAAVAVLLLVIALVRVVGAGRDEAAALPPDCHAALCTGAPGTAGAGLSRAEVAARASQWVGDTAIGYSMSEGHAGPGGWRWYRRDCSGFVSMALRLPDDGGGASTVGLADVVRRIPPRELRPYDLLGRLGDGTAGESGHVQLFLGWADADRTRVRVLEQGGLGGQPNWPHESTYAWPERMADGSPLRAYRYVGIRD